MNLRDKSACLATGLFFILELIGGVRKGKFDIFIKIRSSHTLTLSQLLF